MQTSPPVQALPSSHDVPSGFGLFMHWPVAWSQAATWQASPPPQVTGVWVQPDGVQWSTVQGSPSSHEPSPRTAVDAEASVNASAAAPIVAPSVAVTRSVYGP